ncbi:ABC transporter permease [Paenibacillus sp. LHD-117]|uniref:ABC transporter permease n=1 Tax=Paenibacillus sp. LHD-117 TaxID=3071412 RepID=UPI0027E0D2FF|nr:ABC transporter permease [Paenibacillus sp. LHD-117]MDQ6421797.1 ABC transporter permease [Paenibacillus sp. LHD-117]
MRIGALFLRIVRQFIHDKRTMALLIVAPLLVLSLMYLVFNGDAYKPKLGLVGVPDALAQKADELGADVIGYASAAEAETALEARDIDAYIELGSGMPRIKLEGSDPAKNRAVMTAISEWLGTPGTLAGGFGSAVNPGEGAPAIDYLHGGSDMTSFDSLGPVFIGVFAFFFVFLIAGVSFLKERTSGTLERLLATPLRRWEIVAGYIAGFGLFTGIQAVLIAVYAIEVLGLMMDGSIWYVLLVTLLLSVTALSLGTFLSAFANTEFQMIQFIPLVIVPQIFFSGLFDLDSMSPWLRWLSHLMPLTYGADALRGIMIRGEGWSGIAVDIFVLLGLSLVFMGANVLALRKHRKI